MNKRKQRKDAEEVYAKIGRAVINPENMDPGMKILLRQVRDNLSLFTDAVTDACSAVEAAAKGRPNIKIPGDADITDLKILGAEMRLAFDRGDMEKLSHYIDRLRQAVNPDIDIEA